MTEAQLTGCRRPRAFPGRSAREECECLPPAVAGRPGKPGWIGPLLQAREQNEENDTFGYHDLRHVSLGLSSQDLEGFKKSDTLDSEWPILTPQNL